MHWFWRVAIAVAAGFATNICIWLLSWLVIPHVIDNELPFIISYLLIPNVVAVLAYGLLTYRFSSVYIEHRRYRNSLCVKCGYDLTGNVSGICPECGEKI